MQSYVRQKEIYELAIKYNTIRIADLAKQFDVSIETIRRDINALAEDGMLKKIHGGAVLGKNVLETEPEFYVRLNQFTYEKERISERATKYINSGDVIALDCGVTMISLMNAVHDVKNLTIFTNSIQVAHIVSDKMNRGIISGKLMMIGGIVNTSEYGVFNIHGLAQLQSYRFDKFFTSVTSITEDGCFIDTPDIAFMMQSFMKNSSQTIVLSNNQKFSNASHCHCADFNEIDRIIVDSSDNIGENVISAITKNGCELVVCSES